MTHVVAFCDAGTALVNKGRATDDCLDLCKAFNIVLHHLLVSVLGRDGSEGCTVQWIRNWLGGRSQSIVANGTTYRWRLVPQGLVLGLVLFNIFINDADSGVECPLSEFADDTKLSGAANTVGGREAIQRDPDRLEKWSHENLMRFNKAKCKVLHLGCGKPCYQYKLQDGKTEQSSAKKDLGELVDGKLDISSNVHSQPRKPTISWAASKAA